MHQNVTFSERFINILLNTGYETSGRYEELKAMRARVEWGKALIGDDAWTRQTAAAFGLPATLAKPGRPKRIHT
jgi:hypothetical protein